MPRSRGGMQNHNKLPLQDRIRALKTYKKEKSFDKVAILFNCSAHQIRHIVKTEKKKIISEYVNSEEYIAAKRSRSEKAMKSHFALLMEKTLYEWFQRAQRHIEAGPITNEIFLQKAEDAKKILCMNDFNIDLDWLLKFRQKYDITNLDMTMLRIGYDDAPPALDMNEIVVYVVDQNPISGPVTEQSLSDLDDSDLELNDLYEKSYRKPKAPAKNCKSNNNSSRLTERTDGIELEMPPIANDEQARRHLKPLEEYVLMKENFRAIGIIEQLEEIFNTTI